MRRVFNGLGRGVAVLTTVVFLASTPATAGVFDRDFGRFDFKTKIVKALKKLFIGTNGDGMSEPKP